MNNIQNIISKLPNKPGIYKYLDEEGTIIYIGKAKDLKKRVKSYFQSNKTHTVKLKVLVSKIADIQYTVVDSELEAIMLETNLIKENRPKYNVLMKDDKNFVYIKITTNKEIPKIYLTRQIQADKATYIGPKTSGFDIKNTAKLISSLLPYPKCQINIEWIKDNKITEQQNKKPNCIFKQIDPDHSPCISELEPEQYKEITNKIINFFQGKHTEIIKNIQDQMQEFAQNKEFEKAAILRDRLTSLLKVIEKQKISGTNQESLDVIDIIYSNQKYFANLFQVREGKLISQDNFILPSNGFSEGISTEMQTIFSTFLQQYYSNTNDIPPTILIPEQLDDQKDLESWLSHLKNQTVKINIPKIGKKHDLIQLATKNAIQYSKLMKIKWMSEDNRTADKVLPQLKEILKLKKTPKRIECYDISHLQGNHTIGSMIVFENGQPKKSDYRYFNIKELKAGEINDFDSLKEVLDRRLKYIANLPENLFIKTQKDSFELKNRKTKEVLFELKFSTSEQAFEIKGINTITPIKKDPDLTLETFIKKVIQKTKSKRYLINCPNSQNTLELEPILLKIGFIKIDNPNFNYGYYPQKQVFDSSFTSSPDLIIIDGGKGQLSSSLKSKQKHNLKIPFISLAKKLEEIFTDTNQKILLDYGSPALNLIQQMRDEAHRFAITKNRKDRIKNMFAE